MHGVWICLYTPPFWWALWVLNIKPFSKQSHNLQAKQRPRQYHGCSVFPKPSSLQKRGSEYEVHPLLPAYIVTRVYSLLYASSMLRECKHAISWAQPCLRSIASWGCQTSHMTFQYPRLLFMTCPWHSACDVVSQDRPSCFSCTTLKGWEWLGDNVCVNPLMQPRKHTTCFVLKLASRIL